MNSFEIFEYWKSDTTFDAETRHELGRLDAVRDREEIRDRFRCDLSFGTGGLRGIMGAGTNRMNRYTVGKATMGLGKYLLGRYGSGVCASRGVAIAYDTRNNSDCFAKTAANVLSAMGIGVLLFSEARPTPQLSFAVKHCHAIAGVVLTASHNPKEYNGYKVYDEYGCQLTPESAGEVAKCIRDVGDYREIPFEGNPERIQSVDVTEAFVDAVLKQSRVGDARVKAGLRVVYTPLHGTGLELVRRALARDDFVQVSVVEAQAEPDGEFPTVASPNPEDRRALLLGIEQAKEECADLVLGTDPDSDRVGVAVKARDGYQLLTGNQTGALLMDFVLSHTDLSKYERPAVVKTIVTSELGAEIARASGLTVFSTLTGFKYIGEKITQFERARSEGDAARSFDFVFGYEESYGYLVGTHARDKDAVSASMLICEMAAALKGEGKTLADRLEELYAQYGYYLDALDSFTLTGQEGLRRIAGAMKALREGESPFKGTREVVDYIRPVPAEPGFGELPASDVLQYRLADGSWIAVRPSGTEPKLKVYYSVRAEDEQRAQARLESLRGTVRAQLREQGVEA